MFDPCSAPSRAASVPSLPTYRIEHRRAGEATVLGLTDDPLARHSLFAPLAVHLIDTGAAGVLLLIEEASGEVVARRALFPEGDGARVGARLPPAAPFDGAAVERP